MDKNINLLVVEDNSKIRKLLCNILNNVGFENVLEAENGQEAWDIMMSNDIELVLTDWMMPEMSGIELLKKIRTSSENFQNVPILMITASDKTENILEAAKYQINGYVVKPFSVKTILAKIEEVLK